MLYRHFTFTLYIWFSMNFLFSNKKKLNCGFFCGFKFNIHFEYIFCLLALDFSIIFLRGQMIGLLFKILLIKLHFILHCFI